MKGHEGFIFGWVSVNPQGGFASVPGIGLFDPEVQSTRLISLFFTRLLNGVEDTLEVKLLTGRVLIHYHKSWLLVAGAEEHVCMPRPYFSGRHVNGAYFPLRYRKMARCNRNKFFVKVQVPLFLQWILRVLSILLFCIRLRGKACGCPKEAQWLSWIANLHSHDFDYAQQITLCRQCISADPSLERRLGSCGHEPFYCSRSIPEFIDFDKMNPTCTCKQIYGARPVMIIR